MNNNVTAISVKAKYDAKLEEWGIDPKKAKDYGVTLEEKKNLSFVPSNPPEAKTYVVGGIKIQYFDLDGKPMRAAEKGPLFHRYRYMFGTGGFLDLEKKVKYSQEPRTPPLPYFPNVVNWREINENPDLEIYITEGEMKALKASLEGYPTIALGGVSAFRSLSRRGLAFLPQLEEINWYRRKVYIVYDSDIAEKVEVVHAMNQLGIQLYNRGALCNAIFLPGIPHVNDAGEDVELKCGMDDFLVQFGKEEFDKLDAVPIMGAKPLIDMNNHYCFVWDTALVTNTDTMKQFKTDGALTTRFSSVEFYNFLVAEDKTVEAKKASIIKAWLDWPARNQVHSVTYQPGKDRYIESWDDESGYTRKLNLWRGWGVEAKEGQIKPFNKLMAYLLSSLTSEQRNWVWQWLAYPIQYPGVKMSTCLALCSPGQGTGKTLLGELVGKIYGDNFGIIGQSELQSDFTQWARGKQLMLGDEVSGTGTYDARKVADRLKSYITGKVISINEKFMPPFEIPNTMNFIFTSNHPDAFFLENNDRRFFVVDTPLSAESDAFYQEIADWRDNGGIAALRWYLENLDLAGFNPYGAAPVTSAKEEMVHSSKSEIAQWLTDVVLQSEDGIKVGEAKIMSDLWSAQDLCAVFDPTGMKTNTKLMTLELRRAGCTPAMGGKQVRLSDGQQVRLWVIRNREKWAKTTVSKPFVDHYLRLGLRKGLKN